MYLKQFNTIEEYNKANIKYPNVSFILSTNEILFNNENKLPISILPKLSTIVNATYVDMNYIKLFAQKANKYYYKDLDDLQIDLSANNLGINSVNESLGKIFVYIHNNQINVILLDNLIISSTINIVSNLPVNLILNGFTININTEVGITVTNSNMTIDGSCDGSNIYIETKENEQTKILNIVNSSVIITGGKYEILSHKYGNTDNPNVCFYVDSTSSLAINNASIKAIDDNNGAISIIYTKTNSVLECNDCVITCESKGGLHAVGIYSEGNTKINNSIITSYSDHTANAAGNNYGTTSNAIIAQSGNIELYNCYIYGMHSGMTCKCNCKINKGLYAGYSHGGVYFGGNNITTYLSDATFIDKELPEGFIDDGRAGSNHAALYVGGAYKMTIYVNNCNFYGKIQTIVIKYSSSSSYGHKLYISNSNINLNYTRCGFRNDGDCQIYSGLGNNFTNEDLEANRNYTETSETYNQ